MFGGSSQLLLLPSTVSLSELCTVISLRARQWSEVGEAAEHLIDSSENKNAFVDWALNFRVRMSLKGTVISRKCMTCKCNKTPLLSQQRVVYKFKLCRVCTEAFSPVAWMNLTENRTLPNSFPSLRIATISLIVKYMKCYLFNRLVTICKCPIRFSSGKTISVKLHIVNYFIMLISFWEFRAT